MKRADVVVVGGGHAGCEAAAAAARMGAEVALVTMRADMVGAMSCNPAIGGIGKGHIVREIDAFDGIMGVAADRAAVHYRMLNRSKGKAVQGPRVQADRELYRRAVRQELASYRGLRIIEAEVDGLIINRTTVEGVVLKGDERIEADAVVVASGTFLGGRLFTGRSRTAGGRWGERPSLALGEQLKLLGLTLGRMKTGTPPRLSGCSIDWAKLTLQPSDSEAWTMSPMGVRSAPQLFCGITRTNPRTHMIIQSGMAASPLADGAIVDQGPRYCPSIEDKVRRFGERDGHQIFLEPEALNSDLIYPNGISTSLPEGVQLEFVRSITGLERSKIAIPGYAVEYIHVDPRQLDRRLAVRGIAGLFLAGQINGTTGYEEAAGQGLVAGLGAAAFTMGRPDAALSRANSYIGVMIDDLTLQGITEPYRMLTARAENRLHLRADNAEARLSQIAQAVDCLRTKRTRHVRRRDAAMKIATASIASMPEASSGSYESAVGAAAELRALSPALVEEAIEDRRYAPYVARQARQFESECASDRKLRDDLDYRQVAGLSTEMVDRLQQARPRSTEEARRVRGLTPAALAALSLESLRHRHDG